ncbi:OmpA family protein [Granulicella cerasi]|uniref:OmpA family protein n=1 Tax=Granulicella cerasi TaxID=741063 RepID=A0ABW1Z5A5_9BACT|nr:OmpA family protein [Granulicella cerasi]
MFTVLSASAVAQEATVQGLIIGRDGPKMYVQTGDSPRQIVILQDSTRALQKGGFFSGKKDLGVAALVPGLEVKVDGSFDPDHELVAKKVEFSKSSLKTARQIDAGLNPVNAKVASQGDQLMSQRRDLDAAGNRIDEQGRRIDEHGNLIAQNGQAITATNGRIGQLDTYDEKGSITINFRNGSAVVAKKDKDALEDFVKNASSMQGYMIQVQGYASKTGNAAMNQRLSSERAGNVLTIIQQSGAVPLTRILAPAAMGTTNQVADNHSRSGQAQNRRVVVTVMVNKGITGGPDAAPATAAAPAPAPAGQE